MATLLITERLVLREFTEDDAEALFALDDDPEVMRYIGPLRLPAPDDYRRQIRERLQPYYARHPGYGFFAAVERATGLFIGWFHLRPALDYRYAVQAGYQAGDLDLGYRLRRAAWGHGYATEGSRHLVRRAFADPTTRRIVACALVGNAASTQVLEKVGMERQHEFVVPGHEVPGVRYVLTRERYEINQSV